MNAGLWQAMQEWCKNTGNSWLASMIESAGRPNMWLHQPYTCLGRLALKEEAAGKIRVFAMVDAFTQWALCPLHQRIVSTLKTWIQDGTFDQYAPVRALLKMRPSGLWSYDLSAATDRLPVQIQKIVLQPILGLHGAET